MRDERGMVGKFALVWLLLLAVVAVAAVDVGSIALTRFKVANAADKAAFQAAAEYKESHDRIKAFRAAEGVIAEDTPDAKILDDGFAIDPRTGDVTVKVVDRAWSMVAGRFSYTKAYTKVSATSTSEPPTL
jgi:Flp pilus assembly protein TadG